MKYLMVWTGVTSGSHLGRDDGYPIEKSKVINSFGELLKYYREDANYFKLEPVDVKAAIQAAIDLGE